MQLAVKKLSAYLDLVVGMLSRASNQLSGLLITIVAIPILSPTEFGVFALASSFVAISRTLLYSATFQYIIQAKQLEDCSSECIVVSGGVVLVTTIIPIWILWTFDPFGSPELLSFFVTLAPSSILSVVAAWQEAQLLRHGRLKGYYGVTAGTELLSAAIAVGLLIAGWGIFALAIQLYLRALFQIIGYRFLGRPVLSSSLSWPRILEIARWSAPQYGSMTTGLVSAHGADFIIGAVLSPAATGVFRAANRITTAVGDVFGQPIRIMALTLFARRASEGQKSDDAYGKVLGLTVILPGTALLGLAIVAPVALPLLVGPEWQGVEMVIVSLCLGRFFAIVQAVSTPLLVAYGRQNILLPTQALFSIVLVVGLSMAAQSGVQAAAWAFTISSTIGGIVYGWLAFRTATSNRRSAWRDLAPSAACALAANLSAFGSLYALSPRVEPALALSVSVTVAALAFGLTAVVLRRRITAIVSAVTRAS